MEVDGKAIANWHYSQGKLFIDLYQPDVLKKITLKVIEYYYKNGSTGNCVESSNFAAWKNIREVRY
ncbi:hypothetical protein AGMMS49965_17510 [Bacteroidia bacterium]|nr:hypothetical protein AGMMS49965_17510 [Bacteroidia bacterium]